MMRPMMPVAWNRLRVSRWFSFSLAVLSGSIALQAQVHPAPGFDLFGDAIVRKLDAQQAVIPGLEGSNAEQHEKQVEGYAHALVFHDGTQLRGEVVSLTKEEILWGRPDISEPLRFRRGNIRRIILVPSSERPSSRQIFVPFQPEPPEDGTKSGFVTVKLAGGDWFHGELSSNDGQSFSLKIGDQTSFTLNRDSISWLHIGAKPAPAFSSTVEAPSMDGWLSHTPGAQMEVEGGSLVAKNTTWIGRQVPTLRRFELNFELPEDAEDNTRVWLQPFGPRVNSYTTGTVEMRLGRKLFQHRIFANRMDNVTTPVPNGPEGKGGPVRYRILYDGIAERLVVIRNGQQLGDWKFTDEKNKVPNQRVNREFYVNGICLQRQQGRNNPLKLNRLQLQPWDGLLSLDNVVAGEGDCLLSADGKLRAGRVEALSNGELTFSGEKLGRKPGTLLQFAHEPSPVINADALLYFGEHGEANAAELEIRDGKVRCRTAFAPALEASVTTLQTIVFPNRSGAASPKPSDTLVFRNGDEIPGFFVSAAQGEGWRWQTLEGQEITVRPDHIAGFRSFVGSNATLEGANAATVELRNGDRLRGDLTGVNGDKVQFRHDHLGAFELDRQHLWSLYPNRNLTVLDGGQSPDKWMGSGEVQQRQATSALPVPPSIRDWVYFDGNYILRAQSSASNSYSVRHLQAPLGQVPERYELRFDITDPVGYAPSINVVLTAKENGGQFSAQISQNWLYLHVFSRSVRGSKSRQVQFDGKVPNFISRRNIRLLVDSRIGTADILVDGVFLTRIGQQEAERLPGLGETIRLQPYSERGPLILSNIWLGPWNGELPKPGAEPAPVTSFTNGDVATGTITNFRDGKLVLESEAGPLEVPMDRILSVEFGGAFSSKTSAARIRLADGSALTVDAFRWEGDQFIGQSAVLGKVQVPANLISELALAPAPPRGPKNPPAKKVAQQPADDAKEGANER